MQCLITIVYDWFRYNNVRRDRTLSLFQKYCTSHTKLPCPSAEVTYLAYTDLAVWFCLIVRTVVARFNYCRPMVCGGRDPISLSDLTLASPQLTYYNPIPGRFPVLCHLYWRRRIYCPTNQNKCIGTTLIYEKIKLGREKYFKWLSFVTANL